MSDQDFFFDDEEEQPDKAEKAPKPGKRDGKPAPSKRAQDRPAPAQGAFFEQSTTMTVTSLVAVIGLLLGVLVGIPIGRAMAPEAVPSPTVTGTSGVSAPVLTQEQMQGGLPPGHVPVEDMNGVQGVPAEEATDTGADTGADETGGEEPTDTTE